VKKVGKEYGGCFSCSDDRVGGADRLLVFFYPVKGIWLIFKGSPWWVVRGAGISG